MFDLFPVGGEIKKLVVGVLMALQTLGFDGLLIGIEDQSVFHRFVLVFHEAQLFILAARAVADFAGDALGLELGGFVCQGSMAAQALDVGGGVGRQLLGFRSGQGLEGLGMRALLPNGELLALAFCPMTDLAFG